MSTINAYGNKENPESIPKYVRGLLEFNGGNPFSDKYQPSSWELVSTENMPNVYDHKVIGAYTYIRVSNGNKEIVFGPGGTIVWMADL